MPTTVMFKLAIRLCCVSLLAFSSVALAEWFETSEAIMGTSVQAEIWHTDALRAEALLAQVMTVMWGVDTAFSPFKPDSELSVLNRRAGVGWVAVSAELLDLLARSRQMSEMAHGAFDITYASVGRYYDYRDGVKPSDEKIRSALEAINYRYVELDMAGSRVRFQHPDVYVDLGGIAKGYAVDVAIDLLKKAGVDQASVSAGGDSRILGDRRGQPWTVGVKHPRKPDAMVAILPLEETAVSTSGDYERFFERDGVRYHHILDPTTGDSARRSMSVTILGPQATFTDALSTSVFVLGPEKGLELVNQLPGIDAIIIDEDGNMRFSEDLQELATP